MSIFLSTGLWIAVSDGARAIVFENTGDHEYPNFEIRHEMSHAIPPDREIYSEPMGRVYSRADGRGSSIERPDAHEESKREFAKSLAMYLDVRARQGPISKLILVAPPRMLGRLREILSPATQAKIVAQIDRDYVKMPAFEIEKALKQF